MLSKGKTELKKPENPYLYRILSFERVVQILESGNLYFSHPSKWDDPYENAIEKSALKSMYAQCWCSKGVSDAMWRIYSPKKIGVRIKIRKDALTLALRSAAKSINSKAVIKKVAYLPESEVKKKIAAIYKKLKATNDPALAINALFYKRLAYSHESEYRVVLYDVSGKNGSIDKGLSVKVDPYQLIDSILFDPRAPDEIVRAFKFYLKESINFHKSITKSSLYKGLVKREI